MPPKKLKMKGGNKKGKNKSPAEVHPWRSCPAGMHWVKTHPRQVTPSVKNPDGITMVDAHCRTNRSHKDQLYPDEMRKIVEEFFGDLSGPPMENKLGFLMAMNMMS